MTGLYALMSRIYNPIPAILRRDDRSDLPFLLQMLRSYPDAEMAAHAVSTAVNSPAFNISGCIASIEGDD
jgi:hypothetical protein